MTVLLVWSGCISSRGLAFQALCYRWRKWPLCSISFLSREWFVADIGRAPTPGGQYHWVSEFAPPSAQKILSFITGKVSKKIFQLLDIPHETAD